MVVVDTNVLIHGRGNFSFDSVTVVPGVVEEARSQQGRNVLNNLDYEVNEPGDKTLKQVKQKSEEINSPTSQVDEELVALTLEKHDTLVTDDKALQILALHLEVDYEGFMDEPIKEKFCWENVCSNCGATVRSLPCSRCGGRTLRRKQVRCS